MSAFERLSNKLRDLDPLFLAIYNDIDGRDDALPAAKQRLHAIWLSASKLTSAFDQAEEHQAALVQEQHERLQREEQALREQTVERDRLRRVDLDVELARAREDGMNRLNAFTAEKRTESEAALAAANQEAEAVVSRAEADAVAIKASSRQEADGIKAATVEETDGIKAAAFEEASGIKATAAQEASVIKAAAVQEADGIKAAAVEEAGGIKAAAVEEASGIKAAAVEEARCIKAAAMEDAHSIGSAAQHHADSIIAAAEKDSEGIKANTQLDIEDEMDYHWDLLDNSLKMYDSAVKLDIDRKNEAAQRLLDRAAAEKRDADALAADAAAIKAACSAEQQKLDLERQVADGQSKWMSETVDIDRRLERLHIVVSRTTQSQIASEMKFHKRRVKSRLTAVLSENLRIKADLGKAQRTVIKLLRSLDAAKEAAAKARRDAVCEMGILVEAGASPTGRVNAWQVALAPLVHNLAHLEVASENTGQLKAVFRTIVPWMMSTVVAGRIMDGLRPLAAQRLGFPYTWMCFAHLARWADSDSEDDWVPCKVTERSCTECRAKDCLQFVLVEEAAYRRFLFRFGC
ncbi:hypothetical protein ACHAQA_005679 [Verticillium albo-atrum]